MSLTKLPQRVTIELTNRCNRSCQFCPRHKMTGVLGDMEPSLFHMVIDQLPSATVIVPFFRGESLLHPMFPTLMRELTRFRGVQLASNGDYLNPINCRAILESCTFFSLSLHALQFPKRVKTSRFLKQLGEEGVETQVSIVAHNLPLTEKNRWIDEWSKIVDRVRIYEVHSRNGFGNYPNQRVRECCNKPFSDMVVYWNGSIGLCNHDWNNSVSLGNAGLESLQSIWMGEKYQAVRRLHLEGVRRAVVACMNCTFNSNQIDGEVIVNGRSRKNSLEIKARNL